MNKIVFIVLTCLCSLWSQLTLGGGQQKVLAPSYKSLFVITLGPDFIQHGQGQFLSLLPPFQNYYTNTYPSVSVLDAGASLGLERTLGSQAWIQLSISGYGDTQFSPHGNVWEFGSPEFETLSYSYKVKHARLMLEGKFLKIFPNHPPLHPYFSWGVGAALNHASQYQEKALISGAIPTLSFTNHTQTTLSWSIGLGVDYDLYEHLRLGIGYQLADLGSVSLGPTAAATNQSTLILSHLYTNQLRFQLTYLFYS